MKLNCVNVSDASGRCCNHRNVCVVQDRMTKLPELVAAAKCVIDSVDSNALLTYFGMKTDLRQGAPAIKV